MCNQGINSRLFNFINKKIHVRDIFAVNESLLRDNIMLIHIYGYLKFDNTSQSNSERINNGIK